MAETRKTAPKIVKRGAAQVFDVSGPGKGSQASATSRPLITGNAPVIKDPMVNEPSTEPVLPAKPSKKVNIQPLHNDITPPEEIKAPEPIAIEEPAFEPAEKPTGFPEPAPDAAVKPEEAPGVPADADQRDEDSKVARERAVRLQKMIDEEEYFLPIQTTEQRRSRKVGIIGIVLIIVLALAWYNVALDAALLPNTYNLPHSTFFTVK